MDNASHMRSGQHVHNYVLEFPVGVGSDKVAWRAHHRDTKELVAVLFPRYHNPQCYRDFIESLLRAEKRQGCRNVLTPDMVHVSDYPDTLHGSAAYAVYPLCQTVDDIVTVSGALEQHDGVRLLDVIGHAVLDIMSITGDVPTDLHPRNVLYTDWFEPYVGDVSGVRHTGELAGSLTHSTRAGRYQFTLPYVAPEVAFDGAHPTERSVVFSLGQLAQYAFTASVPYGSSSANTCLRLYHPRLWQAVDNARRHNPEERFETVRAFLYACGIAYRPHLREETKSDMHEREEGTTTESSGLVARCVQLQALHRHAPRRLFSKTYV